MLNLHELSVFLTAAQYCSFSEAGRQLHLSQPAVSQTIDSLERRFKIKLFSRQGRCVRLTEAGQILRPMAADLIAASRGVDEAMASLQGEVIGEMTLGCSTASGKYLLPGMIARFRRTFHQVRINVLVSTRESVLNKLLGGTVAMGVSSIVMEHSDLEYQKFFDDEVILIVPPSHHWIVLPEISLSDIIEEPIILREEASASRQVLFNGLRQHEILPDMLNVSMELGNAEAIVMAVEEELGIAFVSRLSATRSLALGRCVEVKVRDLPLHHTIYMARSRRLPPTRAQSEFWAYVAKFYECEAEYIKEIV